MISTVLFTMLLAFGSNFSQKNQEACYKNLNADDFYLILNQDDVVLIDARVLKEYKKNRIPGAFNIIDKESLIKFCSNVDNEINVLIYSSDEITSKAVAQIFCEELKFKNVFKLNNGIDAWIKRGYDLDISKISKKASY